MIPHRPHIAEPGPPRGLCHQTSTISTTFPVFCCVSTYLAALGRILERVASGKQRTHYLYRWSSAAA